MIKILNTIVLCLFSTILIAQSNSQDLIAASQGASSPTIFKSTGASVISPGIYNNSAETNIRKGLSNFFYKAKKNNPITIAYIGGSITQSKNQYRTQSFDFIQSMFPKVSFRGINAGVSGTDAELGACRLYDQVLKYNPDLVFVEFAVNGGYPQGMEGIVRQIIKHNPEIEICFIYTLMSTQFKSYQQQSMPAIVIKLEEIAKHYNIPSIHMGLEVTELEAQGKLIARGNPSNESIPVFSQDGVHPLEAGGDFYAASIARSFIKMKDLNNKTSYKVIKPLYEDNWENAKMIEPLSAKFEGDWQKTERMGFKSWFPYIMTSGKTGDSFSVKYKGKAIGIFDIGSPETGQLDVFVDGKPVKLKSVKKDRIFAIEDGSPEPIARFNAFCDNRSRGQYFLIETPQGGIHTVTFKISEQKLDKRKILGEAKLQDITANPQKYDQSKVFLGKILLNGEIVH